MLQCLQIKCVFKFFYIFLHQTLSSYHSLESYFHLNRILKTILMIGSSIGFGEEIKKLCQKMCSVLILIRRAGKV